MNSKGTLWITTTAAFIALLIVTQTTTALFGQLVTGSLVNLILIISVMTCGFTSGLTVALVSPIFANLIGIAPLWMLTPFIMAGNAALVTIWHTMGRMKFADTRIVLVLTLIMAAVCKSATLYVGVVRLAIPLFLNLPEQQAAVVSVMFSLPQLFTATTGGALALVVLPVVDKVKVKAKRLI